VRSCGDYPTSHPPLARGSTTPPSGDSENQIEALIIKTQRRQLHPKQLSTANMSNNLEITKPLRKITDASDLSQFASIIAAAFSQDALNRYLFLGRESNPEHPKIQSLEFRTKYWEAIVQPRFENGAILVESHDWAAIALWYVDSVTLLPPFLSHLSQVSPRSREEAKSRIHPFRGRN
jgi:hypothetical protein